MRRRWRRLLVAVLGYMPLMALAAFAGWLTGGEPYPLLFVSLASTVAGAAYFLAAQWWVSAGHEVSRGC